MKTDFENSKILVIGDLFLDSYIFGDVTKISPEAPVLVFKELSDDYRLGGACNVALNVSKLGANVDIIGVTGNDANSIILENLLKSNNIEPHLIKDAEFTTIEKKRLVSNNHQLIRCDREVKPNKNFNNLINAQLEKIKTKYDVVIFSDYMKGTLSNPQKLIKFFNNKSVPVIVDPKGESFKKYKNASILTPNFNEFVSIVGECKSEEEILKKAKLLIKNINLDALLITRSEKGLTLVSNKNILNIPTYAREVFDVTGAGDTVVALLASSIAIGNSLSDASILANTAAGIVVGKFGTSYASHKEILSRLSFNNKVNKRLSKNELFRKLNLLKQSNKKIVFTNGCFDVLHAGHIDYLQKAKNLGDILVVGLNSDSSVSKLKGKGRPLNNCKNRKKVLDSLECVDYVITFFEDTPLKLIKSIKPNVLVKGGDYRLEDIVGYKEVIDSGGIAKIIDFYEDLSSTAIINKQRKIL